MDCQVKKVIPYFAKCVVNTSLQFLKISGGFKLVY